MKRLVNLLPPQEQKQIKLQEVQNQLLSFGIWLFLSFLVLAVLLFVGRFFLRTELRLVFDQVAAEARILSEIRKGGLRNEIEAFNHNLENFQLLQEKHENFSKILMELGRILPSDVTIDKLVINRNDKKIEISGRAGTRVSILKLRENILASPYFTNVNFPLANLERPTDVTWRYRFYFDPTKLR